MSNLTAGSGISVSRKEESPGGEYICIDVQKLSRFIEEKYFILFKDSARVYRNFEDYDGSCDNCNEKNFQLLIEIKRKEQDEAMDIFDKYLFQDTQPSAIYKNKFKYYFCSECFDSLVEGETSEEMVTQLKIRET